MSRSAIRHRLRVWLTAAALTLAQTAASETVTNVPHFRLDGVGALDALGLSVAGLGDVNGDSIADVAAGTTNSGVNGSDSGAIYVVFGSRNLPSILVGGQLDGSNGFVFRGLSGNRLGAAISSCDFNNDQLMDVVTGAHGAATNSGLVAVIYGSPTVPATSTWVGLNGANGFKILGTQSSGLGIRIDCSPDLSGDGRLDLLLASGGSLKLHSHDPASTPNTIDSATLPALPVGVGQTVSNQTFSALGDVNGDGLGDYATKGSMMVGGNQNNVVYVIYGRSDGALGPLPTPSTPELGLVVFADSNEGELGTSIAGIGDVNRDGIDDFIIGEPFRDLGIGPFAQDIGVAYVIYGAQGQIPPLSLDPMLPTTGFRIVGELAGDIFGRGVSAAGDFDDDGIPDIAVGAPNADFNGESSGSLYILYMRTLPTSDVLASSISGNRGKKIDGAGAGHRFGYHSDAAGDFNQDGASDLVAGADGAGFNGQFSGSAYIVFGLTDELLRDGFESPTK